MSPEAQRIAIAETCGWKRYNPEGLDAYKPGDSSDPPFPDYLNDLNAMRGALLILTDEQLLDYALNLKNTIGTNKFRRLLIATAAEEAEAFLKTLGLWQEDDTKAAQ